jgi:hypothetical protein
MFAGGDHLDVVSEKSRNDDDLLKQVAALVHQGDPTIDTDATGRRVVINWATVTNAYLVT